MKKTLKQWASEEFRANGATEEEDRMGAAFADAMIPGVASEEITQEEWEEVKSVIAILEAMDTINPGSGDAVIKSALQKYVNQN